MSFVEVDTFKDWFNDIIDETYDQVTDDQGRIYFSYIEEVLEVPVRSKLYSLTSIELKNVKYGKMKIPMYFKPDKFQDIEPILRIFHSGYLRDETTELVITDSYGNMAQFCLNDFYILQKLQISLLYSKQLIDAQIGYFKGSLLPLCSASGVINLSKSQFIDKFHNTMNTVYEMAKDLPVYDMDNEKDYGKKYKKTEDKEPFTTEFDNGGLMN